MLKESLKIKDQLNINNGVLNIKHTSAKMIGEVTIEEVDPFGNIIFSSKEYNDLTIGGATFILEQMFKKASTRSRFLLNSIDDTNFTQSNSNINDTYISDEKIFGFMIGIGGEDGIAVKAPDFTATKLDKFVPFRLYPESGESTISNEEKSLYMLPLTTKINSKSYKGFYIKKFNDSTTSDDNDNSVEIIPEYTDGSGEVTNNNINLTDSPIYTYSKVIMEITSDDVREYFLAKDGILSNCRINQLGLVAGKLSGRDQVLGNEIYEDIKLVTIVNFKSRDLSNSENTLKMRYKIYCM